MKVTLVDYMGNDLTVVNCARVSFDKKSKAEELYRPDYGDLDMDVRPLELPRLSKRDEKLIKYLAEHKHWCYDDQTEIMTNSGWKFFEDLTDEDLVAEVYGWEEEDFKFRFTKPQKIHKDRYVGDMFQTNTLNLSLVVTTGHRMLYKTRTSSGYTDWKIDRIDDIYGKKSKLYQRTARYHTDNTEGNYDEGLYIGFMLGDGFRLSSRKVSCRLKVPRKIEFLDSLLKRLGKKFEVRMDSNEVTTFIIEDAEIELEKCTEKDIPCIQNKSSEFIRGLFIGLMESDGSVKHRGWTFSSSSRKLFDSVSVLATMCGYSFHEGQSRHLENPNHSENFRGIVLSRKHALVNNRGKTDESMKPYDGYVYCVTVPSGMLLVRRNGKQVVCGNTPFSHAMMSFRITAPLFVARQLQKHQIGLTWNEVSRRYVTYDPEFYIPEGWRTRPENIKQGSSEEDTYSNHQLNSIIETDYQEVEWYDSGCVATPSEIAESALATYKALLDMGVCPEQARMVLPQNTMTSWIWTGSLYAFARVCRLRCAKDTQKETRDVAKPILDISRALFPVSMKYLYSEQGEKE